MVCFSSGIKKSKGSRQVNRLRAIQNQEEPDGFGSSVINFFQRFSPKKKNAETESTSSEKRKRHRSPKKGDGERRSSDEQRRRRHDEQTNGGERSVSFNTTMTIVPYREPPSRRDHADFGQVNPAYARNSETLPEDDEISL